MDSQEIRKRFLDFFEKRRHAIVPSASLIPEGDSSTLFTTAGMQPLVPYLLGEKHSKGNRIADIQKCVRTGDIDEVGDSTHLTFFEMLGNWSLGDPDAPDGVGTGYWKKEAIAWSYELLTSQEEGFGLDPKRLYVTVFAGNENAPRDEESAKLWQSVGIPESRIYYLGESNWWSPGDNGPCGPSTEMFYDLTQEGLGDLSHKAFVEADDEQKVVEIWNDVFMEYAKKDGKVIGKLQQKNVDTGAGLERVTTVLQGKSNVYETDLFTPLLEVIPEGDLQARRIIADHVRAAVFMIADGVVPSNTDRGYILRRLIRRAVRNARTIGLDSLIPVVEAIQKHYAASHPEIADQKSVDTITEEEEKFSRTLEKGLKKIAEIPLAQWDSVHRTGDPTGKDLFNVFTTYGIPPELTIEELRKRGDLLVETTDFSENPLTNELIAQILEEYKKEFENHQEQSRSQSAGKFKGGLGDTSEATIKLHTAHHLLLAALQHVLGEDVKQKGSNITPERLRIDFSFDRKMTDEEKAEVERIVNDAIAKNYSVVRREMPREEAEKIGAEMEFGAKYPDIVSVYFVEDADGKVFSKEFCGGPHVENTGILGHFKIKKEQASSAGVRRIKAVLE